MNKQTDDFEPNTGNAILDILHSFGIEERLDWIEKAFESISNFYGNEKDVPPDVRALREKKSFVPEDYVLLADECQSCGKDQLAAVLYAAGCSTAGVTEKRGEALIKLADLYMISERPKELGHKRDVMLAVDLLSETLTMGCADKAKEAIEGMREQLFDEYDEEPDFLGFANKYPPDELCFAAFCLGVGIGWRKDVPAAARFYGAALTEGYERASYYLNEIRNGRV